MVEHAEARELPPGSFALGTPDAERASHHARSTHLPCVNVHLYRHPVMPSKLMEFLLQLKRLFVRVLHGNDSGIDR